MFRALEYKPGCLTLLDQSALPTIERYLAIDTLEATAVAIERLIVRGAPLIGVAAAYGLVLAARQKITLSEADQRLRRTRPTAVNLMWALDRMAQAAQKDASVEALEAEADRIYEEDVAACRRIGELGEPLVPDGATIYTHCNAGALATSAYGTALAIVRAAAAKKRIKVIAGETRPVLQGARLTAWELHKDGIDVTLVSDGALGHLLDRNMVDLAIVGADRIAKNGDVANKIGTRGVAGLCYQAGRRFLVAAPWSTVDLSIPAGDHIPIEERSPDEVTHIGGVRIAPEGVKAFNPAFDVTPARFVSDLITERGRTGQPVGEGLARLATGR